MKGGKDVEKERRVVEYYVLCNKLKNLIRTGWKDWNVKRERLESVAEHIYGTQMLAIAMKSEYEYDIDIMKVIFMLAVHELEETCIGDLTQFQISKEEKDKLGHEAVTKILSKLIDGEQIYKIIEEFDERKTKEALFAHFVDKLECDLQSKLYDEENCVDLNKQQNNKTYYDADVQRLLKEGRSWSDMWLKFGRQKYNYDQNFEAVSKYAQTHKLLK